MAAKRPVEPTITLERTGGLLPDGIYQLVIKKSEVKTGEAAPYFALRMTEVGGKGNTIFKNLSLSPNARFIIEAFLDACDFPANGPALKAPQLVGKKFWAEIGNKSYKGKQSNEIVRFLTPEEAFAARAEIENYNPGGDEDTEEYEEGEGESDTPKFKGSTVPTFNPDDDDEAPGVFVPNANLDEDEEDEDGDYGEDEDDEYPS